MNTSPHRALPICLHGAIKTCDDAQPVMPFLDEHQSVLPVGNSQCRTGSTGGVQHYWNIPMAALFPKCSRHGDTRIFKNDEKLKASWVRLKVIPKLFWVCFIHLWLNQLNEGHKTLDNFHFCKTVGLSAAAIIKHMFMIMSHNSTHPSLNPSSTCFIAS